MNTTVSENRFAPIYIGIGTTILAIILLLVAWHIIDILLLAFAGILLAIFLRILSNFIKYKTHLSDTLSVSLVLILLSIALILTIRVITPVVSQQLGQLVSEIPAAWNKIKIVLINYLNLDSTTSLYQSIDLQRLLPQGRNILIQAANFFSTTFGFLGSVIVFLFLGLFFTYDPDTYVKGIIKLIPKDNRQKAQEVIDALTEGLRWWLIGKIYSMAIVGLSTALGLWLLNVPLALTLGLLAALLTFIPNIGPILSAIPAILIAVIKSPMLAVYVAILYIVIQTIESYLITPLIQKRTVSQPPALIIMIQLVMALLTGILGLALATPLLVVLSILINKLYIEE